MIEKFVSLVTDDLILEKAERLAIMFGLSVQQLLEYSGDLLLSQERFKHAIALYRLSKVYSVLPNKIILFYFINIC